MLNKNLLIGSLVAGAFLLPVAALAGVVSGQCVNCHTMHDSQDGVTQGGQNAQLLKGGGCAGCHTQKGANGADGMAQFGTFRVPQVDDSTAFNAGGYFVLGAGATDSNQHNLVADLGNTADVALGTTAPGGGAVTLDCADCHTVGGGHHGSAASYRLLFADTAYSAEGSAYGHGDATAPNLSDGTVYDATEMNLVCAGCHGLFHTPANQGSAATDWVRHPTDFSISDAGVAGNYDYTTNYAIQGATNANLIPLGTTAAATDVLMCVTCHYPHGSGNPDLLRFGYNNGGVGVGDNVAGDATVSLGCESCHNYTAINPGM
jgi:hypothetical protein